MSADALGASAATADPRSLVLHLEVCRLQAELERLEGRLADLRANHPDDPARGGPAADPGAEIADEVIDRMVATLLEAGRADIATSAAARQHAAEDRLGLDRARAAGIVASARADLDRALAERGQALHEGWDAGFDVVVLADRDDPPPAVAVPVAVTAPIEVETAVELRDVPEAAPTRPGAAEVEEARTDAAFEAWMAVAPGAGVVTDADLSDERPAPVEPSVPVPSTPTDPETDIEALAPARSRWLLPLEVVGALLAAAVLVVLVLVLVG